MPKQIRTIFLISIIGWISACTTPAQKSSREFFEDLQNSHEGWHYKTETSPDGYVISQICAPQLDSYPQEIRGQCYSSKCKRTRNKMDCTHSGNIEIKQIKEKEEEKLEAEKKERRDKMMEKCFSGNLNVCADWIAEDKNEKIDALAQICREKKIFECKSKFEPTELDSFWPECKVQQNTLYCEESFENEFIETTVKFKPTEHSKPDHSKKQ